MSAPESGHDALAWWAAGLTMLVWSSSYPAITFGLRAFTPEELVVLRFLTASLCFAVPVALGWIRLPPRRDWPAVVLLALIGNVCYQLALCTAMTRISAGSAAVVIALVPAVTAV
ncbi:MAG TPA: DMT family transporter, partial [Gammaproteobacteria bacterium]|nr:DMT family transporter [Gammaproteobacteria bacterium]